MLFIEFKDKALPSSVIPGGSTSPSLAFKLYSKGSPLPNGAFMPGDFSDMPLDQSHMPTTPSEVYIAADAAAQSAARAAAVKAEQDAAEKAAKEAEIAAKIAYADEHMSKDPGAVTTAPAG